MDNLSRIELLKSYNESRIELMKDVRVVSLNEAALLTKQSVPTLRRRIADKSLKAMQYTKRGKWYINTDVLREYMGI